MSSSWRRTVFVAAAAAAGLYASGLDAYAQCALCRTAISGSPTAAKLSQSLNFAIIVLLIPPVLIFCGIFFAANRYRKGQAGGQAGATLKKD